MIENLEGAIMSGAIPYYRIQERIARREARAGLSNPENPERLQHMLCSMARNVNNLLMRIQGCTSLMLMDVSEGQAGFKRLKHIEDYVANGAVLTSHMLACAGRGVYADPVNIPPLLLKPQGGDPAASVTDAWPRIFIIGKEDVRIRPGLLATCRDIILKISGIFTGIERALRQGCSCPGEKRYLGRIRQAVGEGVWLARDVGAVFSPARQRPLRRQPGGLRETAGIYRMQPMAR